MSGLRKQISDAILNIDNKNINYIPDTLSATPGDNPERKVKNLTAGGRSRTKLVAKDASTMIDMVKFELPATTETDDLITEWQESSDSTGVAIRISSGDFSRSFSNMVLINKPEWNLTSDGTVVIEFS